MIGADNCADDSANGTTESFSLFCEIIVLHAENLHYIPREEIEIVPFR